MQTNIEKSEDNGKDTTKEFVDKAWTNAKLWQQNWSLMNTKYAPTKTHKWRNHQIQENPEPEADDTNRNVLFWKMLMNPGL